MKLTNESVNYSATIVRIHNLVPAENSDRLFIFPIHGLSCIVDTSYSVGQLGIVFPAECQLSDDFCRENNLYTKGELNKDPQAKGYIESKRRVRAIKLRGNKSTGLFLPLSSLDYLGIDTNKLVEGESFTHINGVEICRKYVIVSNVSGPKNKTKGQNKKFVRIDNKIFPEHWDTDMFLKNEHRYKSDDILICTQKIHGTSARFTNAKVLRKLSRLERVAKWFGIKVNEYEYDTLAGSRRVIKDIKAESNHDHFYGSDLWNEWLVKIEAIIPKNWVIYGEIIGWVGDSLIQRGYSYRLPQGENKLYIYRIAIVNDDGIVSDLSWNQIKHFCTNNGLNHVPELDVCLFSEFNPDKWVDINYNQSGFTQAIPLDDSSPCDEGICIRCERGEIYTTKLKSPEFYLHESVMMDQGVVDTETAESV